MSRDGTIGGLVRQIVGGLTVAWIIAIGLVVAGFGDGLAVFGEGRFWLLVACLYVVPLVAPFIVIFAALTAPDLAGWPFAAMVVAILMLILGRRLTPPFLWLWAAAAAITLDLSLILILGRAG